MTPSPLPCDTAVHWVTADPFARHLRDLVETTRLPWRVIAIHCGVSSRTLARLLGRGRPLRRIRAVDAARLILVQPGDLQQIHVRTVRSHSTRERARALLAHGHDRDSVAGYLGVDTGWLDALVSGEVRTCSDLVRLRCLAACEAHRVFGRAPDPGDGATPIRTTRPALDAAPHPGRLPGERATLAC